MLCSVQHSASTIQGRNKGPARLYPPPEQCLSVGGWKTHVPSRSEFCPVRMRVEATCAVRQLRDPLADTVEPLSRCPYAHQSYSIYRESLRYVLLRLRESTDSPRGRAARQPLRLSTYAPKSFTAANARGLLSIICLPLEVATGWQTSRTF